MSRWIMRLAGEESLTQPYTQHPWVHACVSAIAKAVSSVPLVVQQDVRGEPTPVDTGPLADLLSRPNKLMSQRKFLASLTQTQQLYGETMLLMMSRNANGVITFVDPSERVQVPEELWPVRGDLLTEVIDERTNLPRAWKMQTPSGVVEIPAESLIHIAEANPYNPIRGGGGPMEAAYRTASKDFVLDRYDEALLQNSGSPGGILSVDGHLTDADQRAISDAWREAHGRPDSHRKTAVLPKGTKYDEIGFSPQEMEFQAMREWNRETIMAIFGVTKPILGLTEGLNYASSMSAFRTFWEVTVVPFLDFLADELQTKFVDRLAGPESEYVVGFDTSGVAALREDADSKVDRTLKLFTQGGRTFNEAAALAGWDIGDTDLDNADVAFMPGSMAPVVEETGAPAPDDEEDAPAAVIEDDDEDEAVDSEELDDADKASCEHLTRDVVYPPGLETEQSRLKYWQDWDADITRGEARIAKAGKRVMREIMLAMRAKLREVAEGPWQDGPKPNGKAVRKAIATEAEIMRLLDMNLTEWGDDMEKALSPRIVSMMIESATQAHAEIGGAGAILTVTDPAVVRYMASKTMILSNISKHLIEDVQRGIVRVLAGDPGTYGSLREAIWWTLAESEAYINTTMKGLGTRASLIARTETTGAANFGRQAQMSTDGIKSNIWLAQPSARDSHAEISGKEVPIGEEFGYGLRYPGDPQAAVGQIANCRCVLLPGKDREY